MSSQYETVAEHPLGDNPQTAWRREVTLPSGRRVVIRPIRANDTAALIDFHERLSATSVHNRFFGAHPHLTPREAISFAVVDYRRRMAFVAVDGTSLIGVGRYEALGDPHVAEVAFVVADDFQRQGLGTTLLGLLAEYARAEDYRQFVAQILVSNLCMREVFARSGLSPVLRGHKGVIDVLLDIGDGHLGSEVDDGR
ncbi:MAG: putative acetyl-CoA synthetase [Acidimicrobiaceae bacterium]|nr:putative acetyl-CoA synthetase [Acidimicrobiaceae bacterium]